LKKTDPEVLTGVVAVA